MSNDTTLAQFTARRAAIDVAPSTRDELAAFIKNEIAKWSKVAQSAGITLD